MTISEHPFFLDGALHIAQDSGYRAGMDAVLLAASINVPKNKQALELGCGTATALLCAAWRNPDAGFYGLEKQSALVQIADENIRRNHLENQVEVVAGNITNLPAPFQQDQFDHVFFNPPFQETRAQGNIPAPGKELAFVSDEAGLGQWIAQASRLVKTRGYITLIHRADRCADIIALLHPLCGDIRIKPIAPRAGQNAHRVLVRARKGVRSAATLLPPLILHETDKIHTAEADAIFCGKQALVF